MSHFLLNLARRAAGLAPVARINPTAPPPAFEPALIERSEDAPTAAAPKDSNPLQPTLPAEVHLEDLLGRLRREIAAEPPRREVAPERPLPRPRTPQEAGSSTVPPIERSRRPVSQPSKPAAPQSPPVPPAASVREVVVEPPLAPPPTKAHGEKASPPTPQAAPRPSRPSEVAIDGAATVPPSPPEKTTVIEIVKVVPAPVRQISPLLAETPVPVVAPAAIPAAMESKREAKTPDEPRRASKPPLPVHAPATALKKPVPPFDAATPVRRATKTEEPPSGKQERRVPLSSTKPERDEQRSRPVPMPKPLPASVPAKERPRAVEPKISNAPPAVEVRIGTLEVRGSPPPPAPQATTAPSSRRETFDSYRSVRDYSGWFRG